MKEDDLYGGKRHQLVSQDPMWLEGKFICTKIRWAGFLIIYTSYLLRVPALWIGQQIHVIQKSVISLPKLF